MLLKRLCSDLDVEVKGKDADITGVASDSRIVAPGNLFIAKGKGSQYISQAVSNGAKVIVTDLYDPFLNVTQVICSYPEKLEALLAARYYENPSEKLFCVGVTGSKGKTTTTYLCHHLLESLGEKSGLLSTIDTRIGDTLTASQFTTHDACANQKFLREMVKRECKAAVLEVSSHGLDQGRVDSVVFDTAIFTNLYPDHLDYHKTVDEYAKAKKKLFLQAKGTSIFNVDSPWFEYMQTDKKITIGIEKKADLQASEIRFTERGTEFLVNGVPFVSPLMGQFNVYNVLCAIALGTIKGKTLGEMSQVFQNFPGVPGRLERVPNKQGIHVVVDYAHTGESLEQVLGSLKKVAKQKMIVVFGCGGDRDKARRKEMAAAAEKFADFSIITTDNPRSEDPKQIAEEITQGFQCLKNVRLISDRKEAIVEALKMANRGDFVVIAGKGHEKVQIFSSITVRFDDIDVVRNFLGCD